MRTLPPLPVPWAKEAPVYYAKSPMTTAVEPGPIYPALYTADQMLAYAAAAVTAERERIAALLDAEHEKRKHLDNHAAFYARMIREQR